MFDYVECVMDYFWAMVGPVFDILFPEPEPAYEPPYAIAGWWRECGSDIVLCEYEYSDNVM